MKGSRDRTQLPAEAARRVELLILDADGVFTDGGIYVGETGEGGMRELLRFHVQDGLGIHLLRQAGIRIAVVSGRSSLAMRTRVLALGIEEIHQVPPLEKLRAVSDILEREGLSWDRVACLADDLADLPILERVGLPGAVVNAVSEVRTVAVWTGTVRGGHGAIREFAEALLTARGVWEVTVSGYLDACREGSEKSSMPGDAG